MVVFITGASSGIGRALALDYAKIGAKIFLFARRGERLDALSREAKRRFPSCEVAWAAGDVQRRADLDAAISTIEERWGVLDIVYANAGFGVAGRIVSLSADDLRRQFEVNVFGVFNTVQSSIALLRASKGRLAIIGSANSYVVVPKTGAYCMSKFAVRAMANALRLEEREISVTLICPGFVESEIRSVDNQGVYHEGKRDFVPSWLVMSAESAVRRIRCAVQWRCDEAVITGHAKLVVIMERYFPRVVRWILHRMS